MLHILYLALILECGDCMSYHRGGNVCEIFAELDKAFSRM